MQDYEGKRGMTWGGGARLLVAEVPRPSLTAFVDVQMLSFYTRGTVWRSFAEEPYIERYDDRYKWNELQLSLVAVWQHEVFKPYAGFGLTNVFGNVTKNVYRIVGSEEEFYTRVEDNFGQDAIPELILGMDFGIGGTATVSGEIRYSDEGDVSFCVGASELWHLK
jgi:hypothetical protein